MQVAPEDRSIEIIAYGDDRAKVLARLQELEAKGYFNLYFYEGGNKEWLGEGLWQQSTLVLADGFVTQETEVYERAA